MQFDLLPENLLEYIASFLHRRDVIRFSQTNKQLYNMFREKVLTNNTPTSPDHKPNNAIQSLRDYHQIAGWFIEQGHLPLKHFYLTPTWESIKKLSRKQAHDLWKKIETCTSSEAKNIMSNRNEMDIELYHQKIQLAAMTIQNYFTKILQQPFQLKLNTIILIETNITLDFKELAKAIRENDDFFGLEYFVILSCLEIIPGGDIFQQTCYLAGFELLNTSFKMLQLLIKPQLTPSKNSSIVTNCVNKFCDELITITNATLTPDHVQSLQLFIDTILNTRYYCENKPLAIQKTFSGLQPRQFKYRLKPRASLLYHALESTLGNESLLNELITMLNNPEKNLAINKLFDLVNNPISTTAQLDYPLIRTDLQK